MERREILSVLERLGGVDEDDAERPLDQEVEHDCRPDAGTIVGPGDRQGCVEVGVEPPLEAFPASPLDALSCGPGEQFRGILRLLATVWRDVVRVGVFRIRRTHVHHLL
jgi:hypothetical protein